MSLSLNHQGILFWTNKKFFFLFQLLKLRKFCGKKLRKTRFFGDLMSRTKYTISIQLLQTPQLRSHYHRCKTSLGCAHCAVFDDVNHKNASFCYSNALSKPTTCTSFQSGTLEFDNGVRCDLSQYHQR